MRVNSSSEKIWSVFAHDFDNAFKWMSAVPHSYGESVGKAFEGAKTQGRICELTTRENGIKASEQFLAYDEANHTATVKIDFVNTPGIFPVKFNTLNFSLNKINDRETEMVWDFKSTTKFYGVFMKPALKAQFSKFVTEIMEELKFYVENDAPHPRKVKAIEKLKRKKKRA